MATSCNVSAEIGATSSVFPFTESMFYFLCATDRRDVAEQARIYATTLLSRDEAAEYDRVIEIDLSDLEPHVNRPFSPDLATTISEFADVVERSTWPKEIGTAPLGSCTNGSYEDISRAANIAEQARSNGIEMNTKLLINPGSERTRATLDAGHLGRLTRVEGTVLANACGPCIGNWRKHDIDQSKPNSILSSYNRNFAGRNDGNA